jgi:hypothetical protein
MKLIRLLAAGLVLAVLTACQSTSQFNTQVASIDQKLRDKCAYLQSGVSLARVAVLLTPAASPLVEQGSDLIDAYCGAKPVTDAKSAMDAMERVIVAVRPIAAKLGK